MSSVTTYSSLIEDIKSYCERDDEPFVSQIPRFIFLAENRIASENKPLGFVRTVSGTLNGDTMVKPVRWRRTKNFSIRVNGQRKYLYERGYEYCRTYWPDSTQVDVPEYYADYDYEHFFICPKPDAQYQFEIQYYELPEPLSEVNQVNWNTQYAPQMLLYASLIEAMPFLKTSERIPEFQALYDRALAAMVKEDQMRMVDAAAVRG